MSNGFKQKSKQPTKTKVTYKKQKVQMIYKIYNPKIKNTSKIVVRTLKHNKIVVSKGEKIFK